MTFSEALFLLVCGVGALNCVFLAAHLAFRRKGQRRLNLLLAALILTFSVRVSKAVWVFFLSETHPAFEVLWMALFVTMGFLFYVYVAELTSGPSPMARRLVPVAAATAALTAVVYSVRPSVFLSLLVAAGTPIGVAIATVSRIRQATGTIENPLARWLVAISTFMLAVWGLYVAYVAVRWRIALDETVAFNAEAVIVSLTFYALLFVELRDGLLGKVHQPRPKALTPADVAVQQRLETLMTGSKVYLDPSLSLPTLAKMLKISPQHLSRILNANMSVGFNDYVNRLRVEEACRLLCAPDVAQKRIGSLAFDCGFNSASVFYAAFKKCTGRTPTEYLDERVRA